MGYPELQEDMALAWNRRENAHAPYSHFKVCAVVRFTGNDLFYVGVNVENASYGASICAERSAILSGISAGERAPIKSVLVASNAKQPAVPCAVCLQFLAEFSNGDTKIYLVNGEEKIIEHAFSDLLPHPFTSFVGND